MDDSPLPKLDALKRGMLGANDKSKKEIEKILATLNFELIILLAKNSQLHQKLIESQFCKNLVNCMEKINRVGATLTSSDNSDAKKRALADYGLTKEDVLYYERLLCFIFFQISHYRKFDDDVKIEGFRFLINQLCNSSHVNRNTAFNSIRNILKIRSGAHINALIEAIDRFLHSYNTKALVSKMEQGKFVELFGIVAVLEYLYEEYASKALQRESETDIAKSDAHDAADHQQPGMPSAVLQIKEGDIAYVIPYLLSDIFVEKFELELPISVLEKMTLLAYCEVQYRCRLLFLLVRLIYIGVKVRQNVQAYLDKIAELIGDTLKSYLSTVLKDDAQLADDFVYGFYGEFLAGVLEQGIDQIEGASSLEHAFFWEFFSADHEYTYLTCGSSLTSY